MSADGDALTRPEQFAAIGHARTIAKRLIARGEACSVCKHSVRYFGTSRCTGNPARMFPLCEVDKQQPRFELNPEAEALKGIIHG